MGLFLSMCSYLLLFLIECNPGWFDINCSRQCSGHCKDGSTCNHVTGQCDTGCDAGWTGSLCEKGSQLAVIILLFDNLFCKAVLVQMYCLRNA